MMTVPLCACISAASRWSSWWEWSNLTELKKLVFALSSFFMFSVATCSFLRASRFRKSRFSKNDQKTKKPSIFTFFGAISSMKQFFNITGYYDFFHWTPSLHFSQFFVSFFKRRFQLLVLTLYAREWTDFFIAVFICFYNKISFIFIRLLT